MPKASSSDPKPRFIKRSREGKKGIESRPLSRLKFQQKRTMDRCVLLATSWSTYWSTVAFFKILPTSRKRVSFTVIPCLEDSTVCCLTYGFVRSAEHILPIKQKDLEPRGMRGDRTVLNICQRKTVWESEMKDAVFFLPNLNKKKKNYRYWTVKLSSNLIDILGNRVMRWREFQFYQIRI